MDIRCPNCGKTFEGIKNGLLRNYYECDNCQQLFDTDQASSMDVMNRAERRLVGGINVIIIMMAASMRDGRGFDKFLLWPIISYILIPMFILNLRTIITPSFRNRAYDMSGLCFTAIAPTSIAFFSLDNRQTAFVKIEIFATIVSAIFCLSVIFAIVGVIKEISSMAH